MKRKLVILLLLFLFSPVPAFADNGIINVESSHDVATTSLRLEKLLRANGMTIFARVDHAKGAEKVGKGLPPMELLIFGNPKLGTVLMQCNQTAGLDLPQKMLIRRDRRGKVWISYNDPVWIAKRHGLVGCGSTVSKIREALERFASEAAN